MTNKPVWMHNPEAEASYLNIKYCAGRDVAAVPAADDVLVPYDIWTNRAHNYMLKETGVLSEKEMEKIFEALKSLENDYTDGSFKLNPDLEDVHINVENYVNDFLKENISGKMHSARSRNDQVTCDLRLYLRDQVIELARDISRLILSILDKAMNHTEDVLPGLTHFQPAIVSTFSHFLASYAQALLRDLERFYNLLTRMNVNPLGAAASYGTSWPIDRTVTSEYMGFDGEQENSLDCITNRWEFETEYVSALSFFMTHLSIIAQDLILFSSPYVGYLEISDDFVTGSSIMPQKRNPDFAEITRGKAACVSSNLQALFGICKGMNSGYNRETQWIKYIVMDMVRETKEAPAIFQDVFETIKTNPKKMLKNCEVGFINAVEFADYLARNKGLTFREAYHIVGSSVNHDRENGAITLETLNRVLHEGDYAFQLSEEEFSQLDDYQKIIHTKNSQGAPAPEKVLENIEKMRADLADLSLKFEKKEKQCKEAFLMLKNMV